MKPMTGAEIVAEAFEAFDRWCAENDPEGEMDVLEQAEAYNRSTLTPPPKPKRSGR